MKLTSRRTVAALILLIIAIACAWAGIGFSNRRSAVLRYKQQLANDGEKLLIDDLLPPAVAPEQNGVSLFRRAYSSLTISMAGSTLLDTNPPPAMRMVAPGKAMIGWKRNNLHELGTNTWE